HYSVAPHLWRAALRAGSLAAASASRGDASAAADLRGATTPGNLERRRLVNLRGRRSGTGRVVCRLHSALGEGFSLGVARLLDEQHGIHEPLDGETHRQPD